MASKLLRITRFTTSLTTPIRQSTRTLSSSRLLAIKVDSNLISRITAAEKQITNSDEPAKGGPTAAAQSHVGQELTSDVLHDITMAERKLTGKDGPITGGPTSVAQSAITAASGTNNNSSRSNTSNNNRSNNSNNNSSSAANTNNAQHTGRLDSSTMRTITEKEKEITGQDGPVPGGPTAKAQQHAGEPITSEALHDITEGEKKITGGERVKGGPTSAAQSELGKSRS
jgi:hypothetical protein